MVLVNRKQQKQLATAFIEQLEAREKHYSMAEDVEDPSLDNAYLVQDSFIDIMVDRGERIVGWKVVVDDATL